jgi:galactokinase
MKDLKQLINENEENFRKEFSSDPLFTAAAPGRINIIGEHTDYNDGLSMPAAINRWVLISISKREDDAVHVKSFNYKGQFIFNIGDKVSPKESWMNYVYGAFHIFNKECKIEKGFNACIYGNVPLGSGVSSSAALEVAVLNALRALYKADFDDLKLVKLCQKIEHEYLGLKSGLLDQYASQFSKAGKLMILDFQSLSHTYINAESKGWKWVLVNSNVKRELAGSKYSERVDETANALEIIKKSDSSVKGFRDITLKHLSILKNKIQSKRIEHFVTENERVKTAAVFIGKGEWLKLGSLLNESHFSLRDKYEVSCEELDFLQSSAIKIKGCSGSRMMGGGFGGCTINLVPEDQVESFKNKIASDYLLKFNMNPEISEYLITNGAAVYENLKLHYPAS